ncbi:MAG: crossover junction endodeoxyribonuclease RuvC [Clostridiales bacterium]|nr:crossover junction endodeoxyribonuclease RuvC [Clostridiales bacterium]
MRVLGIDPGLATMGYGVVDAVGSRLAVVDYGVLQTAAGLPFPRRLELLYEGVNELLALHKPTHVAFEELFFYQNTTTALPVSAGRGVALLAAQQSALPLYEYTPMQIKLAVTGNGHADKLQVQQMVQRLLNLGKLPKPDDAADALAVAICLAVTGKHCLEEYRIL